MKYLLKVSKTSSLELETEDWLLPGLEKNEIINVFDVFSKLISEITISEVTPKELKTTLFSIPNDIIGLKNMSNTQIIIFFKELLKNWEKNKAYTMLLIIYFIYYRRSTENFLDELYGEE